MVAEAALKADERPESQTVRAELALRDLVLSGAIKPGERLSELALVGRVGVSRTPVRAALMRLAEEGLVEPIPSGGFVVRAFTDRDVCEALEICGTMEGLAVRLATERGVLSTAIAPLHDLLARLDVVVAAAQHQREAFADYIDLNSRFHRAIVALADSRLIERQLERVMTLPFASPSALVQAQLEAPEALEILRVAQDHHRCVVEAIEAREGARAEALMKEHSRLAQRNLAVALRSQGALKRVPGSALIRLRV